MRSSSRYEAAPPSISHRRKTPSFSSSLLDSILRSIDDGDRDPINHDQDLLFFANNSEPKEKPRAIMIDEWMETHNHNHNHKGSTININGGRRKVIMSPDDHSISSCSGTTTTTTTTTTSSNYRSLPNSFTISREEAKKKRDQQGKLTKLRAMKKMIYGDLKKPVSPGTRISAFIHSLFASSSSSKKPKSIINISKQQQQQDTTMTKTTVKRQSVPENDPVTVTVHDHRRCFTDKNNYKNFVLELEDKEEDEEDEEEDEDEDDLFELEIGRELPVFETTDLRKIRI